MLLGLFWLELLLSFILLGRRNKQRISYFSNIYNNPSQHRNWRETLSTLTGGNPTLQFYLLQTKISSSPSQSGSYYCDSQFCHQMTRECNHQSLLYKTVHNREVRAGFLVTNTRITQCFLYSCQSTVYNIYPYHISQKNFFRFFNHSLIVANTTSISLENNQILWPPCTASIAPRIREDPFFHSKFLNWVCYKKTSSAIPRERLGIFFLKTRSLLGELNMWTGL